MVPYPSWLNAGDNSWQLTAGTLVGLMSIPALAVLYGGLVQKKWAINTMMMVFTTFCLTLIIWVLWAFKMGFGTPLVHTFLGDPRTILGQQAEQGQANIPLLNGLMPSFSFPESSLAYFQFVFAAITPILWIGSVLGRISFKAWLSDRAAVDHLRLRGERVPALGRRLLGRQGRAGLLRRVRHPPGRRRVRLHRGGGDRAAAQA